MIRTNMDFKDVMLVEETRDAAAKAVRTVPWLQDAETTQRVGEVIKATFGAEAALIFHYGLCEAALRAAEDEQ
jgi:hypothetical protein